MRLRHATHVQNLPGIMRGGLLAHLASGRMPAVWGVLPSQTEYAILHCCTKRGVRIRDVVVLEFSCPRKWAKRFALPGCYYIPRDIPPERIRVVGRVRVVKEGGK